MLCSIRLRRLDTKINQLLDMGARSIRFMQDHDSQIRALRRMMMSFQDELDQMKVQVTRSTDVVGNMKTILQKYFDAQDAAGDDVDEMKAATATLKQNLDELVAASVRGTPVDPAAQSPNADAGVDPNAPNEQPSDGGAIQTENAPQSRRRK